MSPKRKNNKNYYRIYKLFQKKELTLTIFYILYLSLTKILHLKKENIPFSQRNNIVIYLKVLQIIKKMYLIFENLCVYCLYCSEEVL